MGARFRSCLGSLGVATPPFSMDQEQVERAIKHYYTEKLSPRSLAVLHKVLSHPSITKRHFAFDVPDDLVDEPARFHDLVQRAWIQRHRLKISADEDHVLQHEGMAVEFNHASSLADDGIACRARSDELGM